MTEGAHLLVVAAVGAVAGDGATLLTAGEVEDSATLCVGELVGFA